MRKLEYNYCCVGAILISFDSISFVFAQQTFVLMKTYWRRFQDVFKTSSRHNCNTSSWRRFENKKSLLGAQESIFLYIDLYYFILYCLAMTSWKCLEDVLKTSWKRLEEVLKASLEEVLQARFEDVFGRGLANTSWRRLEDVLKTSWKTSWRRLGKQEIFAGCSGKHIFIYFNISLRCRLI